MNVMKRLVTLTAIVALVFAFAGTAVARGSDFALFDGTNPANRDEDGNTGVLCGVTNKKGTELKAKPFTYYFSVTAEPGAAADAECRVRYSSDPVNTDPDFVRYFVPPGTSLNINQAGGSNVFDSAVRLDCDTDISGAGSIIGLKKNTRVFCLSCDETGDTDDVCDLIINNLPGGTD